MSKISKPQHKSEIPNESEMLDEYDFSQGVRGKYFQRFKQVDAKSIQSYRNKVFALCLHLSHATDPIFRANTAKDLAEAATTLAQLEAEAAQQVTGD